MGTPRSSRLASTRPPHESWHGWMVLPAWLVRGGLRDGLPHPVDTMLTFSTGNSSCLGIFLLSTAGTKAAIWASCVSIILLKLSWFLSNEDKVSIFMLRLSRVLSLVKRFLFIFLLILVWPRTRSHREGWFELKLELKLLPPWNGGRGWFHPWPPWCGRNLLLLLMMIMMM